MWLLSRIWWALVILASTWVLVFVFGPPSVQKWQINATYSVLQEMGF